MLDKENHCSFQTEYGKTRGKKLKLPFMKDLLCTRPWQSALTTLNGREPFYSAKTKDPRGYDAFPRPQNYITNPG
jgi:hypothetical protein